MSGNFTGRGKTAARGSHSSGQGSGSTRPQRSGAGLGMYQAMHQYLTKHAQSPDDEYGLYGERSHSSAAASSSSSSSSLSSSSSSSDSHRHRRDNHEDHENWLHSADPSSSRFGSRQCVAYSHVLVFAKIFLISRLNISSLLSPSLSLNSFFNLSIAAWTTVVLYRVTRTTAVRIVSQNTRAPLLSHLVCLVARTIAATFILIFANSFS